MDTNTDKTPAPKAPKKAPSKSVAKRVTAQVPTVSPLQIAVRDARTLHNRLKEDFRDGIVQIAECIKQAKVAAKKEGVAFDSLFGAPEDASKFPFTQNWANTIVRISESGVLTGNMAAQLPADLNVLGTLASVEADKRPEVLDQYYKLVQPIVIEGILIKGARPQEAMKKAKAEVVDVTPKSKKKKAPKNFDAKRMARKLHAELGDDGLSDLVDACEQILAEAGVRS